MQNTSPKTCLNVIKINVQGDPSSLNPHLGLDLNCRSLQKALFEGLTRLDPNGIPQPAAAEKIDISPSKTTFIFTLRPMKWSNGEPVTAYDFEKTWKAALAPVSNCLRSDLLYPIKNARKAKKGEVPLDEVGVRALDAKTLVVDLQFPAPYFLELLASPAFFPLYEQEKEPSVFNGPFKLNSWEHDSLLILDKNPLYWDSQAVHLDKIEVSFVQDPRTALLMYEKGDVDWAGSPFTNLPIDEIAGLQNSSELTIKPVAGVFWFYLNTEVYPLQSVLIRKALSYAVNRKAIADHLLHGEIPTRSLIPPTAALLKDEDLFADGDVELAQKIFEEGLNELHISLEEFPTLTISYSDAPGHKAVAEAVAQQWETSLGVHVELQGNEWNTFFSNLGTRQFEISGCAFYAAYNDPCYSLEFFKYRSNRYNSSQWQNPEYQQFLDLADNEKDIQLRNEYLKKAELLLLDEMPIIPIFAVNYRYLKKEAVKGVFISDLGHADFKWAYLDKEQGLCQK